MDDEQALHLQRELRRFDRRLKAERPQVGALGSRAVLVLGAIARAQRPVQPGDLAAELDIASSNIATALRELEEAGLVERTRDDTDRRRVAVSLSSDGRAAVAANRAARASWVRDAANAILTDDEQERLLEGVELLGRLTGWRGGAR